VRLIPAPILIALLAGACGSQPAATAGHPAGRGDVVLRVTTSGGFISPAAALSQPARFTLYGDGTAIVPLGQGLGAMHLGPAEVRRLLAEARAAIAASGGDVHPSADMPATTVSVSADGRRLRASGAGDDLQRFAGRLPRGPAHRIAPTALAVFVAPFQGEADGAARVWPLDPGLLSGRLVAGVPYPCAEVAGGDVPALLDALAGTTARTPWLPAPGAGDRLQLIVRPAVRTDAPCTRP
jgi:hypothetical protein